MNSPITGKPMTLTHERRSMAFRKESFEIVFHYYRCEDSGEQFTTTELDELNINQLYNQYREKHAIPFPEEITRIREKYDLSAAKMSDILGLGANSYRQYESGDIPSTSNAMLIRMADDPHTFQKMVQRCSELDTRTKEKLLNRIQHLIEARSRTSSESEIIPYLLGDQTADVYSGYRTPSMEKFTEMVVYFADRIKPYKTKLNKLLFYADFLYFKQTGYSISGVRYHAITMGPVPNKYQSIFEYLFNKGEIDILETESQNGYTGEQFIARKGRPFRAELFTDSELATLERVVSAFEKTSINKIIQISHLESAWMDNEQNKSAIRYDYAFDLNQI